MSNIGNWVRRVHRRGAGLYNRPTLYHRVESEIAEDVITNCGRRMKANKYSEFVFQTGPSTFSLTCSLCRA